MRGVSGAFSYEVLHIQSAHDSHKTRTAISSGFVYTKGISDINNQILN